MSSPPPISRPGRRPWSTGLPPGSATAAAAAVVFFVALVVYVRTLLAGPNFGDWAEMQMIPAQLGVPHPTGYPLYVLLGKAFSLLPLGSVAWRADLLSACGAAAAAATAVLISIRLGVRPLLAALAGLTLAVTGTLWLEATFAEMNGLHLFLVAAAIHRALVWRATRRDRDLLLGALLAGLAMANHLLAATVVPIVIVFVAALAWRRFVERPALLLQAALLFLAGLSLYLLIPLRALAGPAAVYGPLLTWDGLSSLVTGAQFRTQMHFLSGESLSTAWGVVPAVVAQLQERSNLAFVVAGFLGAALLFLRDRWTAAMVWLVVVVNVYFFANYVGNLEHYLLVTWLVLAVGLAVAAESVVGFLVARLGPPARHATILLVLLPVAIAVNNWPTHDQSANHVGEQFAASVFDQLPANAVLLTYWDALTNLSYEHCIEGRRPDVALRHYDAAARITCDPVSGSLEEVARDRPVFALFPFERDLDPLRRTFRLIPVVPLALPYGARDLDHSGVLYRLEPKTTAGLAAT